MCVNSIARSVARMSWSDTLIRCGVLARFQVDGTVFPLLKDKHLTLRSIDSCEEESQVRLRQLLDIYDRNVPGLLKYIELYSAYLPLVTMQAQHDVEAYLKEPNSLVDLKKVFVSLRKTHSAPSR